MRGRRGRAGEVDMVSVKGGVIALVDAVGASDAGLMVSSQRELEGEDKGAAPETPQADATTTDARSERRMEAFSVPRIRSRDFFSSFWCKERFLAAEPSNAAPSGLIFH